MLFNKTAPRKGVAYYRHSAEDKQENSVLIQREHTHKFAKANNIEIIHEESDEGKSGLLAKRPGFERLFNNWVRNTQASFDCVLVYDVSRWGRFQNQNEAASYEFECEKRGKKVIYVARGIPDEEQQLSAALLTSVERYNAAEFSRQLSSKVFYGSIKVSEQGYSAGGMPCYGLGRVLLDENKKPITMLKKGEHKQISNQRVTFVPLNDETTRTVQEIFDLLVNHWHSPSEIAKVLNDKKIPSAKGGKWNSGKVLKILTNETYTGARIYNKTQGKLKKPKRDNPRSEWIICPNAFPAVVDPEVFKKAQESLYWLMPAKWKRGLQIINKMKGRIRKEIRDLYISRKLSEDEVHTIVTNFPIVFSVCFYRESTPHWCFVINESMKKYKTVLGVGIALFKQDPIEKLFILPTNEFEFANYLVFSQDQKYYANHVIANDQVQFEIAIDDMVKDLIVYNNIKI